MEKLEYSDFYRIDAEATKCNLSNIIRLKGISTQTIAKCLGLSSDRNVRNWRNGTSFPDYIMLPELAALLHVNVEDIYVYAYQVKRVMMDDEAYTEQVNELMNQLLSSNEEDSKPIFSVLARELCPIKNWEELSLFLPYLDYSICKDVMFRLRGVPASDFYFEEQMEYVWRNIKKEVKEHHRCSLFLMRNKFIRNLILTNESRYNVPDIPTCLSQGFERYKKLYKEHTEASQSINDLLFDKQRGWL